MSQFGSNCHVSLQVSVITAVFNRAATLDESLRSVQAQTCDRVEHIVMDGGSTDGTLDILERHRHSLACVVSEPDKGVYHALNKGIARATGDIIGFMHADDRFASPDVLSQVAAAFANPMVQAVYGDLEYVHPRDWSRVIRYWRAGPFERSQLVHGWMPPHPTFYVRRHVYERLGGFDTRFRIAADYEHMLRLLWRGNIQPVYIPQVLVHMRTGGISNGSLMNLLRKSREDYAAMRQNGVGGVHTLLLKNATKLPQFVIRQPAADYGH